MSWWPRRWCRSAARGWASRRLGPFPLLPRPPAAPLRELVRSSRGPGAERGLGFFMRRASLRGAAAGAVRWGSARATGAVGSGVWLATAGWGEATAASEEAGASCSALRVRLLPPRRPRRRRLARPSSWDDPPGPLGAVACWLDSVWVGWGMDSAAPLGAASKVRSKGILYILEAVADSAASSASP
jgi:hypothetical protein